MKNIKIYYHITNQPGANKLTTDRLELMKSTGLWDAASEIILCTHYDSQSYGWLTEYIAGDSKVRQKFHDDSVVGFGEQYTNRTLKTETDTDSTDSYILRIHNKGCNWVSSSIWEKVKKYSDLLDHHNIVRWKECIRKLEEGYDTVGIMYLYQPVIHYSGNIWWASSQYIKKLPLLKPPHETGFAKVIPAPPPPFHTTPAHDAEFWIGVATPNGWDLYRDSNSAASFDILQNI